MKIKDFLGLFLLACGWGPTFLMIKLGVESVPPLVLTSTRLFIASFILLAYCLLTKKSFKPAFPYWKPLFVMAMIGNAIPFVICAWAETLVQSSTAGVIEGTVPVLTAAMTFFFFPKTRLPKEQVVGVAIGFLGILMIFLPDMLHRQVDIEEAFLGKILLVVMAAVFSASFIYSKERLENVPSVQGVALQFIMAALVLTPLSLVVDGKLAYWQFTKESLALAALLGIWGTAFPWCLYFYLLKKGSAAQLSLAIYLLPVVAIFLGRIFLDETIRWNLLFGTGIILFSLLLAGGMLSKARVQSHTD